MIESIKEASKLLSKFKFILIAGNGGSALTASHFSSDLSKLEILAYCLSDNPSTITALTNDYNFDEVYTQQYKNIPFKPEAIVIFSVHGGEWKNGSMWSKNLVDLAEMAKHDKIPVISITGNDGGLLKIISDVNINVDSDNTGYIEGTHSVIAHQIVDLIKNDISNSIIWNSTAMESYKVDD